jgi:hypothetical protein
VCRFDMLKRLMLLSIVGVAILCGSSSLAGPLSFFDPVGPRRWETGDGRRIHVGWVGDVPDRLKSQLTPKDLDQLVRQSFQAWSAVSEGALPFTFDGSLGRIIHDPSELAAIQPRPDILVLFDLAGFVFASKTIFSQFPDSFNPSDFIGLTWEPNGAKSPLLGDTIIAINNPKITVPELLSAALLHEAGHAVGLADSPVGWPCPANRAPVMCARAHVAALQDDDKASLWGLYWPRILFQDFGWITGKVMTPQGDILMGLNGVQVLARLNHGSDQSDIAGRYGTYTPYGVRGNQNAVGIFRLAVPPGDYDFVIDQLPIDFPLPVGARYANPIHAERSGVQVSRRTMTNLKNIVVP